MTARCCRNTREICRLAQYRVDRSGHCTDSLSPTDRYRICSNKSAPGFCWGHQGTYAAGRGVFLCCDGHSIESLATMDGVRDCSKGEDERIKFIRCSDLTKPYGFDLFMIPLVVTFVVIACCWRLKLRRRGSRDPNGHQADSVPSLDSPAVPGHDVSSPFNQVGPGWVVGSLSQPGPDSTNQQYDQSAPFAPTLAAPPPPYSEIPTSSTQSSPFVNADNRFVGPDLPPSYDEAVKLKS